MKNRVFIVALTVLLSSCNLYKELPERTVLLLTEVPDVTVNIKPENYKYGQRICLTCEDSDAVIFYTRNGSIPDENNYCGAGKGAVYISDVSDSVIKAVAKKNGYSGNMLELHYILNADLYLEDLGQGWILKYSDGRVLKCSGNPLKAEWKENENFDGYSLYDSTFTADDLKNVKWQSESGEDFIVPENARFFSSCMLIGENTIIYRQDMMLIENGINGYKNWFAGDAAYYPGIIGTPAQGCFIILYDDGTYQYYYCYSSGSFTQDNYYFTDTKIILKSVTTGNFSDDGKLQFGNYIYQLEENSNQGSDYLAMNDIVGVWKYSSWSMTFKSNGDYVFNNTTARKYHLYGKYLILEGIGGRYVYNKAEKTMTFVNTSSQLVYKK